MSALLCTFVIGDLHLAVPVAGVREVLRPQELTPVPGAGVAIRGLTNLRGEIVAALDLGRLLGVRSRQGALMSVVARTQDGELSLLVDEIGDVIESTEPLSRPPETIPAPIRAVVAGVCELPDRLLLVLDVDRIASKALGDRA